MSFGLCYKSVKSWKKDFWDTLIFVDNIHNGDTDVVYVIEGC